MSHAIGRDSLLFLFYFVSQFLLGDREKFVVGISPTDGRQACFPNDERAIFTMPLITDAKKKRRKIKREAIS